MDSRWQIVIAMICSLVLSLQVVLEFSNIVEFIIGMVLIMGGFWMGLMEKRPRGKGSNRRQGEDTEAYGKGHDMALSKEEKKESAQEWFEREIKEARTRLGFRVEECYLDFTSGVCERMDKLVINKKELARRLGTNEAYITKVLIGYHSQTITLKTMVRFAKALQADIKILVVPSD